MSLNPVNGLKLMLNRFRITVRSTDNGQPAMYREEIFTIAVSDVNEPPTSIQVCQ